MQKIRILLADNEPEFLKTRQKALEAEGYEVIPATNPEEAKSLLKKNFNLAIVDLRLTDDKDEADMSGLALIKSATPEVPKLLLTGFPTVEVARRALRASVDGIPAAVDVLSKQDTIDSFLLAVAQALGRHASPKYKSRMWFKITLTVLILVVIASTVLVFVLGKGVKEVFITILVGLILEVIAALFVKSLIEK